jgi:hypothetical protein
MYLGAKLKMETFEDGMLAWGLGPESRQICSTTSSCKECPDIPHQESECQTLSLPKTAENLFPLDFTPEEDLSLLLESSVATYYT